MAEAIHSWPVRSRHQAGRPGDQTLPRGLEPAQERAGQATAHQGSGGPNKRPGFNPKPTGSPRERAATRRQGAFHCGPRALGSHLLLRKVCLGKDNAVELRARGQRPEARAQDPAPPDADEKRSGPGSQHAQNTCLVPRSCERRTPQAPWHSAALLPSWTSREPTAGRRQGASERRRQWTTGDQSCRHCRGSRNTGPHRAGARPGPSQGRQPLRRTLTMPVPATKWPQ